MKNYIFSLLFIMFSLPSFSQTQLELTTQANQKFIEADNPLNQVYQQILREYKTDAAFIKNLKASQRLWIQFRDAELKTMYPDRARGYYGSTHSMCVSAYKTRLTAERIQTLRQWLDGREEGDSCSPSIKVRK